ncbi:hypothetical protein SANTM175S_07092 [Streptomyces antimycoticus]
MVVGLPGEPTGSWSCHTERSKLPPGAFDGSAKGAAAVVAPAGIARARPPMTAVTVASEASSVRMRMGMPSRGGWG